MLCNSTTGFVFCVYLTYSSPKPLLLFCFGKAYFPAVSAGAGAYQVVSATYSPALTGSPL